MSRFARRFLSRLLWVISLPVLVVLVLTTVFQRSLEYFPSHGDSEGLAKRFGLERWLIDGDYTGYARIVNSPRKVWLFVHGNGGQAADRSYVFGHFNSNDAIYILEYPGYGDRPGSPSQGAFDAAALKAYTWLVQKYGIEKLALLGESLGSGPTCTLTRAKIPPRQIVLVVPFDRIVDVAAERYPFLPARLVMFDRWDNVAALQEYRGKIDIFGGMHDNVIPVGHAQNLAKLVPQAIYHEFNGGHNWGDYRQVDLSAL